MAHAGGRPKIVTSDFVEGWQQRIIDLMTEGASKVEVYAMLDIDSETFARLVREDEEFSATIKNGERLSQAWWEQMGRKELRNKEFSYTGWYMNMKNRFGWRDRTETDITTKGEALNMAPDPIAAADFAKFLKSK